MTGAGNLLVIFGPTASGKSALAMEVARQSGAEILSADSMQVYRHMDIGTAKPTAAERAEVLHHGVDVVEPVEEFTVAKFVTLADATIAQATESGRPLIITGGTPLYFKSLFDGIFEGPGADAALREELRTLPNAVLHAQLSHVDPTAAARIHENDTKRLIRAIEVFKLTGKPITSWQTEWAAGGSRHQATFIGLQWERDALNRRINARAKLMIEAGWLEETRALYDRFGNLSLTSGEATGYRHLHAHLGGLMTLDDAVEQIKISTRQLARRQMKWFRRFPETTWLNGERPTIDLCADVMARWRGSPTGAQPG